MISKTLERVVNDPMCIDTGNYGLRCDEIGFLLDISKKDPFAAITRAYNYGDVYKRQGLPAPKPFIKLHG